PVERVGLRLRPRIERGRRVRALPAPQAGRRGDRDRSRDGLPPEALTGDIGDLSSIPHDRPIWAPEGGDMSVDDALLPAARHLFGPDAEELLRTALAHVGARLLSATPVQAQHRPGHDLVV